ncbi:MAG TPA: BON domain-containing protein [Pirellulales bacterium]|nr:BON domain-containing protein [Pirellulales bacterium]
MRRFQGMFLAGALCVSVAGLAVVRAQQPPPAPPPAQQPAGSVGQRVGTRVDNALDRVEQGAASAEAAVQQGFASARAKIDEMGTEGRVYGRLRWDKALAGSTLSVQASGQVVTLTGTVPDQAARTKANVLARDTIGVSQVIDQLSLASQPH